MHETPRIDDLYEKASLVCFSVTEIIFVKSASKVLSNIDKSSKPSGAVSADSQCFIERFLCKF